MPPEDKARLNACLADYHRRVGMGKSVDPGRYKIELGDLFPEFEKLLIESAMIDDKRRPAAKDALPRPFGGYTLLRELGRGASGVVYEAVNRELGRKVALKILRVGFDTHVTARERFRREARACAQVRHENVVEIYEAGVEDDRPFYAMRLLEGVSLSDSIADGGLPELRELADQMADVAGALQVLHDADIVHRDVKPSNLMVQPDGRFILADFGLARTTDAASLTQTGDALGTPLYMSPEQMLGKREEIDGRTDIYGLGATLYQAVTGKTPFQTKDLGRLLRMVLTERPTAPRKINPSVPKDCEQIILKCLEKRPEDRYATAAELEADLRAFARGDQVAGKPISAARHNVRRLLTSPVGIAAVLLGVLAGVLLAVTVFGPDAPKVMVAAMPKAEVWLDGKMVGETELDLEVEPGQREIVLRAKEPGFLELRRTWEAKSDGLATFDVVLPAVDWKDHKAFAAYRKSLGIQGLPIEKKSGSRSSLGDYELPIFMYPRGRVLSHVMAATGAVIRVDVPTQFDASAPGEVVFELAGKEVSRTPFPDPEDEYLLDLPIPASVGTAIQAHFAAKPDAPLAGRLAFVRKAKVENEATFQIVPTPKSVRDVLARIDADLGDNPKARLVRSALLAEYFVGQQLPAEALRVLRPWTDPLNKRYLRPDSPKPDLRMYLLARDAIELLFEPTPKLLDVSPLQNDVLVAVGGPWPDDIDAAAYANKGDADK